MVPADLFFVFAGVLEGPSNNLARRALKAADAGEGAGDVARRVDVEDVVERASSFSRKTTNRQKALKKLGFQDHHIISDKNALTKNHELWDLAGLDKQSRVNKIFLPKEATLHPTRSLHWGRHRVSVSRNLAKQMDEVVEIGRQLGWSQQQYRQALRGLISQERQLLRSGHRALNVRMRPWAQ